METAGAAAEIPADPAAAVWRAAEKHVGKNAEKNAGKKDGRNDGKNAEMTAVAAAAKTQDRFLRLRDRPARHLMTAAAINSAFTFFVFCE